MWRIWFDQLAMSGISKMFFGCSLSKNRNDASLHFFSIPGLFFVRKGGNARSLGWVTEPGAENVDTS